MMDELDRRLGVVLAAWVGAVRRRPLIAVVAMLLAAALSLWYAIGNLEIKGDTEFLFSAELPFKRNEQRYISAFPAQRHTLFAVVDASTPERAGEVAQLLATRLREETNAFRSVYLPGGGEFFERHAYLYLDTDELEDLADRLAEAQPYLAQLSREGSLHGLASIVARGARAVREGDVSGDQLGAIFERFAAAIDARLENRPYHLSWAEVVAARAFEGNPRQRFLLVEPVLSVRDFQPAEHAFLTIRRVADELALAEDVRVRITGDAALTFEEMKVVRDQAAAAGVASFVLVGLLLFAALRSLRLVGSTLATLLIGLVYTAGFTAVAIGHLNLISVSFAVLFIGLGVDFGIHFCVRYRELMGHGRAHAEALSETARDVGSSIALCAVTTAIGFFAFVPTDFVGVAELGLISGAGMLISFFCTLTFLPALLSLLPALEARGDRAGIAWSGALVDLPVRYPRSVRATALALGAAAVLLLPQARFDNNPLNVRDPDSESVRTLEELLERGGSSPWSLNALAPELESAELRAQGLRELAEVERVVTLADFVPTDQEEKLDIIEDVALFLEPLPAPDGASARATPAQQIAALRTLARELGRLLATPDSAPALAGSAAALRASLDRYLASLAQSANPDVSLEALEDSLLGSLPEQLRILGAALTAGRVTLEHLPEALTEQMMAADGRVRIQIFPRDDLKDHAALAGFVDAVRSIEPQVAGSAAEIVASGRTVVASLREALLYSLVAVTILMLLLWRRLTDTALVLIPLALASALTVATAVLLDIPFNFADVIVLPLLLGIGVDSGIHLVHRARASREGMSNLLGTSTARAVGFSALTTIASFGSLGLASHRGLATLGQLLTVGVSFTLLCNLIVLPALIVLHPPRAGGRGERRSGAA
jgi:hopanoid biosynthesis associated RND transporter like protein HpnN